MNLELFYESHMGVIAGLVPAITNVKVQSENNRGGRTESAPPLPLAGKS
jgi:hypothetical protein